METKKDNDFMKYDVAVSVHVGGKVYNGSWRGVPDWSTCKVLIGGMFPD